MKPSPSSRLTQARGLFFAPNGDLLVGSKNGYITATWDADGDGLSGSNERAVIARADGLNHDVYVRDGYLFASSADTAYRWPYNGERTDLGPPQVIITDISMDSAGSNAAGRSVPCGRRLVLVLCWFGLVLAVSSSCPFLACVGCVMALSLILSCFASFVWSCREPCGPSHGV